MEHFMTSEEIAELLHVDPVTIRRLVNKGELSAYRIGADYRFAPSDLQDYLQRQRITAHAQNGANTGSNNPLDQFSQMFRRLIRGKHTTPSDLVDQLVDRFTKRASHVLKLSQEEAQRFQHNYVGTEHLLLGLIQEGGGAATEVLNNLGVKGEQIRHDVEAIVGRGERAVTGEAALTPRAKKVIEFAVDEARRLNHRFIGTEHLLLGLIREGEGIAANVLKNLGLQLEQVRTETREVLRQYQTGPEETPVQTILPVPEEAAKLLAEDEAGLLCPSCGARCPSYFRYCFNCSQPLNSQEAGNNEEE